MNPKTFIPQLLCLIKWENCFSLLKTYTISQEKKQQYSCLSFQVNRRKLQSPFCDSVSKDSVICSHVLSSDHWLKEFHLPWLKVNFSKLTGYTADKIGRFSQTILTSIFKQSYHPLTGLTMIYHSDIFSHLEKNLVSHQRSTYYSSSAEDWFPLVSK